MMKTQDSNKEWQDVVDSVQYMKDAVDLRFLVESLGFTISHETSKELRGACIIHGGDNKTSFRFNKSTRTWACFSHKCNEQYGSDVIGLIRSSLKIGFMEAVEYLKSITGNFCSDQFLEYKKLRERNSFIEAYSVLRPSLDESVFEAKLKLFQSIRSDYFIDKGFTKDTLDFFEVGGGYIDKYGIIREVIPIRSVNGVLLAYALRDKRDHVSYDSKYIFTEGFNKDSVLYNLNNSVDLAKSMPLIVVEGYKSVWRLHQYGIRNVVAVMGSSITTGQEGLILSYAPNGVVIMFDNDLAGISGSMKAFSDLNRKTKIDVVFITEFDNSGKGLDPSDLSKVQIYGYLKNYVR